MAMGDPANEPGNPDGCQIDKASIKKATSSLARLSAVFIRTAAIIESSVRQMVQSIQAVGKVKVKGGGGGAGGGGGEGGGKIELPFNMKIWERTRKRTKAQQKKTEKFNKLMAKLDAELAQEKIDSANREIVQAKIDSLNVESFSKALADQKAKAAEIELAAVNSEIVQARIAGLQQEAASKVLADQKARNANAELIQARIDELNVQKFSKARQGLESKKSKELYDAQLAEAEQRIKSRNDAVVQAKIDQLNQKKYSDALKAQQDKKSKELYDAQLAEAEEKIKSRNEAIVQERITQLQVKAYSQALRDQVAKKAKDEADARKKFFDDQEKQIIKQAPIAYNIGKSLGFLSGKLFKIISSSVPIEAPDIEAPKIKKENPKSGGEIKRFAKGGQAKEKDSDQSKGTDTVPAMLTPGEFVVSKKAAQQNRGELEAMNQGKKRKTRYYAAGGLVAAGARAIGGAARGVGAAGRGAAAGLDASGFQGAANAMLRISSGAERVVGSLNLLNLATLGPVDSFNKLVSFAGSFVEAVNPALMQQLGLAFKDLQAIIGVGLQPIIAAAIPIIRAFADKLQPVMQALMPTFDKLAQSMIQLSGPIITLVIEMFGALEPVIETVSVSIQAFAGILTAVTPIMAAVFKELIYRITQIVTTFQWFIGKIISWIPGTGDTGKKLMESASAASKTADLYYQGESKVQKAIEAPVKKGAAAGAAAKTASFTGISDFGKNLMQQAFSSSTQAAALKTAEYSEKTYTELAKLNAQMGRADPAAPAAGVRRAGI